MSSHPGHESDRCNVSNAAASDGERLVTHSVSSSGENVSSSSSEDGEAFASPPPNKRRKYKHTTHDPRVDSLVSQIGYITNYLTQLPHLITSSSVSQDTQGTSLPVPSNTQSQYLINPAPDRSSENFQLGELSTGIDERRVIPSAQEDRLRKVNDLQHFNSSAWKGMRYKSLLQSTLATPGFVALKINEELCHFNKQKDFLASSENMLAGLTNVELEHQELLRQGLQDLLNWAGGNPGDLNPASLFEKVSQLLGPGSPLHKCSEKIMQIICGRRSECIEIRRERIVKEINSPALKATLRNIPPSAEYLFSREALQPVIQSLGGTQTWLNKPDYIKEKRVSLPTSSNNKQERKPLNNFNNNKRPDQNRSLQKGRQNNFQASQRSHNFRGNTKKDNIKQQK